MTLEEIINEGQSFRVVRHLHIHSEMGKRVSNELPPSIEPADKFAEWVACTKRFISINYPDDNVINEFKESIERPISDHYIQDLVATLKSLKKLPQHSHYTKKEEGVMINITQTQSQSVEINIILDCLKNHLPEKQYNEIREIAKEERDATKAGSKILEKLKGFGIDVLSSIVANLITNQNIWSQII